MMSFCTPRNQSYMKDTLFKKIQQEQPKNWGRSWEGGGEGGGERVEVNEREREGEGEEGERDRE